MGICVTWLTVAGVAAGTSHKAAGSRCDDDCWVSVENVDGEATLLVFVSDGAGSAQCGLEGSQSAIAAAVSFTDEALRNGCFQSTAQFADGCIRAIRSDIATKAKASGLEMRDFAATFIGLIVRNKEALAFQIGDGGLVLQLENRLELAFVPRVGEYANMTSFVTDDEYAEALSFRKYDESPVAVAAFSDGLQRLALDMSNNTPHEPFFRPLFEVVAQSVDRPGELQEALLSFLDSTAVNDRTDDDKTLVLAVRFPAQ
jgi:Protein phosphatase 2C